MHRPAKGRWGLRVRAAGLPAPKPLASLRRGWAGRVCLHVNLEANTSGTIVRGGQAPGDHCQEAAGWSGGRGRRMCGQEPFLWFYSDLAREGKQAEEGPV